MKRLAISFIVFTVLLGVLSNNAFAGTYVWKSAAVNVPQHQGGWVTLINGVKIYKYYSQEKGRYRFSLKDTSTRFYTATNGQVPYNTINAAFHSAVWKKNWYSVSTWGWGLQWEGPSNSVTAKSTNWIGTGFVGKTFEEGQTIALTTYYTINDGRYFNTEVDKYITLDRNMTDDPWY